MKKFDHHPHRIMVLILGIIGTAIIVAINSGYAQIPYFEIFASFLFPETAEYATVVLKIRLPRIVVALLCGMGLALSGCALQAITQNALADPGILGINAGAGFMVLVFFTFFPVLHLYGNLFMPIFAMIGGVLVVAFLYGFARRKGQLKTGYLLLGGIAASAGFSALMLIIGADMENNSYQSVARWMAGNIWGVSWFNVITLLPYLTFFSLVLFSRIQVMDLLALGEDCAIALGVSLEKERRILLVTAVGLAASCISVSGGIGFVGLVSPHLARRLVGGRHKYLIPTTALMGGLLVLLADTIGRSLFLPIEIPVGIILSILAAPYFFYLLRKQ